MSGIQYVAGGYLDQPHITMMDFHVIEVSMEVMEKLTSSK